MLISGEGRYSYIRVTREIEATPPLEAFLARVAVVGTRILGFKDSTYVAHPSQGVGISTVRVYPASSLRLTQFERLAPAGDGLSRQFSRVFARMTASDKATRKNPLPALLQHTAHEYGLRDDDTLLLRATGIELSTKPEYAHRGDEYALTVASSPTAACVRAQNAVIHQMVRQTGPGSRICQQYEEVPVTVPFVRVPAGIESDKTEEFLDVAAACLPRSSLLLVAGPLEWNVRIR